MLIARRLSIGTLSAVVSFILASAIANATNWGSTTPGGSPQNSVSVGNDQYHRTYLSFMDSTLAADTKWAMDNSYGVTTDLVSLTGTYSNADVIGFSGDYGSAAFIAWVSCPAGSTTTGSHPTRSCQPQELFMNQNATYASYYDSQNERRYVGCHELGHTVGLRHTEAVTTCLNSGNYSITYISAHDISHIDGYYAP